MPERWLDHPPDVDLIRLARGQIPISDLEVPVNQLRHGSVRLGLAARCGLLEQLAELDLRGPFGLAGLPQPDLTARQRVGAGVDAYAERPAGQLLNVAISGPGHDGTITWLYDIVPRFVP